MDPSAPPSSSAGHAVRASEPPASDPTQRKPGPGEVVSALLAGVPTLVFTAIGSAAVSLVVVGRATGAEAVVTLAVAAIPAIGLAVFVRRWVLSLRELMRGNAIQWPFLAVPFFLVVGVAVGVAFAGAVTQRG
jgi:hypothetical protein